MAGTRVYFVFNKRSKEAYVGKGRDGRVDESHSAAYHRLEKRDGTIQWESAPFSTSKDSMIAEATAIKIADLLGASLINKQKDYPKRFHERFPIKRRKGSVRHIPTAIIVTITSDPLEDGRVAPNAPWTAKQFAERVRKWWPLGRPRVERWKRGEGAPELLVAVHGSTSRILAAFRIDNSKWRPPEDGRYAVPLMSAENADVNDLAGKKYTGNRQGPLVTYGSRVGE